ncbi:glycoside hydrolase family 3 protein [Streptomyces sp. YIM 98790]|uniref:glycoside hydrolase family 3 protein n=1 Tax=Streptomyces sp. YIM 98790 TaxID=2689077 RepID=UPI00140DE459|nr:glycoside hydrolase family 3 protein [Streptomyces sp. YIM 98790]
MSDEARIARDALAVLQPAFDGTGTAPDWLLRGLENGMTGVGIFGRNVVSAEQLAALTGRLRAANPEVLLALDEEGGDVTRLEVRTGSSFPGSNALGAVDDPALTRAVAAEMGRRIAAAGPNLVWGPSADVNSDPRNPVIGTRSFGDDPGLVARHTAAFVEGLQSAGIAACVKHFPGHGDTDTDSHLAMPRIPVDLDTLHARELVPFRAAIAAGTRCVMSAHIVVPALDAERPGTLSPAVLTGLLRAPVSEGGLGFEGVIFTDALDMDAIAATYGMPRGAALSIVAGADAICVAGRASDWAEVERLRDAIVAAVRSGELPEERLHDAAERVRALGRWAAEQRTAHHPARPAAAQPGAGGDAAGAAGTAAGADGEIGLAAARRALRITPGDPGAPRPVLTAPPYVAEFSAAANIAVGAETAWGVGSHLDRLLPGTRVARYGRERAEADGTGRLVADILAGAGERPVVAVVRDVHRHPWMAAALDALLAARPDTLVVEMGIPQAPPRGALHLATHGAARVCGQAAAEALTDASA